jgi:Cu/Ag efflux protein CusF
MNRLIWPLALVCASSSWAGTEWVRGVIVEQPLEKQVTIQHETIKSIRMGAMTMPFLVDEKVSLKTFKVGDHVKFMVQMDGEHHLKITALKHAK